MLMDVKLVVVTNNGDVCGGAMSLPECQGSPVGLVMVL